VVTGKECGVSDLVTGKEKACGILANDILKTA
jgi:hypothetical protein